MTTRGVSDRGGVYVIVMMTVLVVTLMGIASVSILRVEDSAADERADARKARTHAGGAIELGVEQMSQSDEWFGRDGVSGWWFEGVSFASGDLSMHASVSEESDGAKLVRVTGRGRVGDASQLAEAWFLAREQGVSSLSAAVYAGEDIIFDQAQFRSDGQVRSGGDIDADSAQVNAGVGAAGQISGATYLGETRSGAGKLTLPPSTTVQAWADTGTQIPYEQIPSGTIDGVYMGREFNPYTGEEDPRGVYVVECEGQDLVIRDSWIRGTLVILDARRVVVDQSVRWEPDQSGGPIMLVSAQETRIGLRTEPVELEVDGLDLLGDEEMDGLDAYNAMVSVDAIEHTGVDFDHDLLLLEIDITAQPGLRGLVYLNSPSSRVDERTTLDGALLASGMLEFGGTVEVRHDQTLYTSPTTGFSDGVTMEFVEGSWRRVLGVSPDPVPAPTQALLDAVTGLVEGVGGVLDDATETLLDGLGG